MSHEGILLSEFSWAVSTGEISLVIPPVPQLSSKAAEFLWTQSSLIRTLLLRQEFQAISLATWIFVRYLRWPWYTFLFKCLLQVLSSESWMVIVDIFLFFLTLRINIDFAFCTFLVYFLDSFSFIAFFRPDRCLGARVMIPLQSAVLNCERHLYVPFPGYRAAWNRLLRLMHLNVAWSRGCGIAVKRSSGGIRCYWRWLYITRIYVCAV